VFGGGMGGQAGGVLLWLFGLTTTTEGMNDEI